MSLKPPSLWIEQRGLQHRVYWRNRVPGEPAARSYLPFYERVGAPRRHPAAGPTHPSDGRSGVHP